MNIWTDGNMKMSPFFVFNMFDRAKTSCFPPPTQSISIHFFTHLDISSVNIIANICGMSTWVNANFIIPMSFHITSAYIHSFFFHWKSLFDHKINNLHLNWYHNGHATENTCRYTQSERFGLLCRINQKIHIIISICT